MGIELAYRCNWFAEYKKKPEYVALVEGMSSFVGNVRVSRSQWLLDVSNTELLSKT